MRKELTRELYLGILKLKLQYSDPEELIIELKKSFKKLNLLSN